MRIKAFVIILAVLLFPKLSFAHSKLHSKRHHVVEFEFTLESAVMRSIISPPHTSSWLSELAVGAEVGIPFANNTCVFRLGLDSTFIIIPTVFVGLTLSSSIEQNISRHFNFGIGVLFSKLFYPTEIIEGGVGPIIRLHNTDLMHSLRVANIAFFPALVIEREQDKFEGKDGEYIISVRMALQFNFDLFKL